MPSSTAAPSAAIVIFGASGDLAHRKLIPAVYELARENMLGDQSYVVGYARSAGDDNQFRKECRESIARHARTRPIDEAAWSKLEQRLFYLSGDYDSSEEFLKLAQTLRQLDDKFANASGNRLFYIATPPNTFEPIIRHLGDQKLMQRASNGAVSGSSGGRSSAGAGAPAPWQRIIIEKPFGHDLASARELNRLLHRYLNENQVYRIDHYLGKETVQNLMVMRFANSIFEPIWNYKYIDHVQITVAETLGVAGRGGYYDRAGAMRDMVQNHMFQLMALVAMEPPAALDATSIRDEKVKVFKCVRPVRAEHVQEMTVRGQYAPGMTPVQQTEGYLKEKGVAADSTTETFAALKLYIDNWRWSGMPFYLRTGKFLPGKLSEVVVRFRSPPLTLFQKQCESPVYPNDLIIRVQPDEGISVRLNGKVPGGQLNIKPVALDFLYKTTFKAEPPDAYERLISDALAGDQTLFIRADETEAAWQIIDPVEQAWEQRKIRPELYDPGTWGPRRAMDLIEHDGRRWLHSLDGEEEPIIACSL